MYTLDNTKKMVESYITKKIKIIKLTQARIETIS
jgi:hypothetical protein